MTSLRREGTGRATTVRERLPTNTNANVGLRTGIKINTEGIVFDTEGFPEPKDFFNRVQMPKNVYFDDTTMTTDESDVDTTMMTDTTMRTADVTSLTHGRGLCIVL